ncbi:hypothetical protein Val02_81970 [Virgisporangium aliadipatigenens]|uniref:Uncharacterized protein n=1 Tax=Virgisporangium aliadipatigenens TaxID=741659 RepID=A0A8J4DVC7_9ACTN|nr:hypothetical protein [Virgisporangium aliadipatigenens]GIJ51311.1 hypothetical protein Val02_81970 [Virgisporangium aliadipatigenens]
MNDIMQWAGFVLLVAAAAYLSPAAALAVAGVILVAVGNLRSARRRPPGRVRFTDRLVRVIAAYRAADGGRP